MQSELQHWQWMQSELEQWMQSELTLIRIRFSSSLRSCGSSSSSSSASVCTWIKLEQRTQSELEQQIPEVELKRIQEE